MEQTEILIQDLKDEFGRTTSFLISMLNTIQSVSFDFPESTARRVKEYDEKKIQLIADLGVAFVDDFLETIELFNKTLDAIDECTSVEDKKALRRLFKKYQKILENKSKRIVLYLNLVYPKPDIFHFCEE